FEARQTRGGLGIVRMGDPFLLADHLADRLPDRRLGDEVDVGVGVGLPALALQDPAGLAAARGVAGAWHRLAELAMRALRPLRPVERLLGAQLDAAEMAHAVLHGAEYALSAPRAVPLIERGDDAERQMQAGAAVADLRAGDERRAVVKARGGSSTARALRHV